ncbi:hypothetical protein [Actinomadura napierensis]|uniref:Uncharacterized protein n=1 Tax=Actinomadura napierensis TaxID=267854 RepID=A0ABN3AG91_9ACTN
MRSSLGQRALDVFIDDVALSVGGIDDDSWSLACVVRDVGQRTPVPTTGAVQLAGRLTAAVG